MSTGKNWKGSSSSLNWRLNLCQRTVRWLPLMKRTILRREHSSFSTPSITFFLKLFPFTCPCQLIPHNRLVLSSDRSYWTFEVVLKEGVHCTNWQCSAPAHDWSLWIRYILSHPPPPTRSKANLLTTMPVKNLISICFTPRVVPFSVCFDSSSDFRRVTLASNLNYCPMWLLSQ